MKKYIAFLLVILALASGCAASDAGSRQAEAAELPTEQPTEAPTEAPTETPVPTDTPRPLFNGPVGLTDKEWETAFYAFSSAESESENEMFGEVQANFHDEKTIIIYIQIKDSFPTSAREMVSLMEINKDLNTKMETLMKSFATTLNAFVAALSDSVSAYDEPEDGYGAIFDLYDVCFIFYDKETGQYFLKKAGSDGVTKLKEYVFDRS